MQLTLKQRYLNANAPSAPAFDEERRRNFEKLLVLISTTERAKWLSTGFNCGNLIESYKQVYGLTSQQFETLLMLLSNIALKEEGLSTETRVFILRLVNTLTELQIKITHNFTISNRKLIELLQSYADEGVDGTLRNSDAVVEELSKFTLFFSRFGEEVVEEALALSVEYNDIRYLVIFLRSIRSEAAAKRLLGQLFSDNNLWDRDSFWFFILSELVKKFPRLDYSAYYQTIMQEVIKAFTTLIDGDNEDAVKKLTASDAFLQVQPALKSVALALAYLLLPDSQPQHVFIRACVQRLFNIVITSLDHINPPDYLNDLLGFIKAFVRAYLLRYRGERGMFMLYNEDVLEDYHEPNQNNLLVDSSVEEFFDSLWDEVIPKIVYLEDAEECKPSKIIAELCMYKPERFLEASMQAVLAVTGKEDPTLISLHGAKITILFLQEYIITDRKQHLSAYLTACSSLLSSIEKLGVPDNLDIVELVFRTFLYLTEEQMDLPQVQSLVEDSLATVLNNLEPMSIGLEGSEGEQAELYIDLSNIFFPFLLRLDQKQLSSFAQRFTYRLINQIPQHQEAYEMISIALTYIDPTFADAVFKHILKELLSDEPRQSKESKEQQKEEPKEEKEEPKEQMQNGQMAAEGVDGNQGEQEGEDQPAGWQFITPVEGSLHARNEQALKWFTALLQCIFQYHPNNVLKHWGQIQRVINLLLVEWEEQSYLEIALDIIYNVILCLCKPHLPSSNFTKARNADYRTLSLDWIHITPEVKALIDYIYEKYYQGVEKYLRNAYGEQLKSNQKELTTLGDFQSYCERKQHGDVIRIRKRNLKLVDFVLMPEVSDPQDSEDRKIIYRALSLQYTVLSALMIRVPFHAGLENIGDFFTQERYLSLRKRSCEYLEWVLQLLGHFDLMTEEAFTKIFNFYWRESHDEVSYTAAIVATNEKISPYYYPQLHRKKELLRSPFLIVNQAYLVHMVRLEFHLILAPTAHLNNPRYLESNFILGLNSAYEPSLHSYFPPYVEVHQYHRQLVAICRYHLDSSNTEGYLSRYLIQQDPGRKERLGVAVRSLMVAIKRLLNVFSDNCCMRDEFIRNTVFELISLYKVLPKKTDKTLLYEMVYVMLVFSFDPLCLNESNDYSLSKYWTLRSQNSSEIAAFQIVSTKETPDLQQIIEELQRSEVQFLEMVSMGRGLRLTRSCSFEHEVDLPKQMERAVSFLIKKIEEGMPGLEKDFGVYLLMLLLYSNNLPVEHPLIGQLIKLIFRLCQLDSLEIFDMSKTGLFHLLNRFNYHRRTSRVVPNAPIRRPWKDFLTYKYLGGNPEFYQSMKFQKNDENFYPSKELTVYQYSHLAADQNSPSIANQRILLNILQDEVGMLKFLKNCSRDPDLKQTQLQTEAVVTEEDFKTVSSSAHKLMHFIWDCNPSKTPLFMGVLERYQASPLNFYNRFFRKALRIGGERVRQVCANITAQLRTGQPEEVRLSFYISCELMMRSPTDVLHRPFLDYLGECSKENFDFALMGFYGIFTSNFVTAERNYQVLLQKLRSLKGAPRFRHFQLLNTYMISQGRFARGAATEAAQMLLKGISEGGDEISEAVVSMITECFVQAVNLKLLGQWVQESQGELVQAKKLYLLNEFVGYNDEELLIVLLTELMKKAREEEEHVESTKLRIYSQIVRKILASITIYRFNNYFYKLLRELILFVLERPQSLEGDAADQYVVIQLSDSEYPQEIYQDLVTQLLPMTDRTPYVVKKKLIFLQGLIIHRSFRLNRVEIPPLLSLNEKLITLDYIITVSTIARLMTPEEITSQVQHLLGMTHRKKHETYRLIALLLASGVREYDWKERVIRDLIKHKKDKLVKESISQWWKAKTPETPQQLRIAELVRNFENPYSYFA